MAFPPPLRLLQPAQLDLYPDDVKWAWELCSSMEGWRHRDGSELLFVYLRMHEPKVEAIAQQHGDTNMQKLLKMARVKTDEAMAFADSRPDAQTWYQEYLENPTAHAASAPLDGVRETRLPAPIQFAHREAVCLSGVLAGWKRLTEEQRAALRAAMLHPFNPGPFLRSYGTDAEAWAPFLDAPDIEFFRAVVMELEKDMRPRARLVQLAEECTANPAVSATLAARLHYGK